jgi:hypothetical protein
MNFNLTDFSEQAEVEIYDVDDVNEVEFIADSIEVL